MSYWDDEEMALLRRLWLDPRVKLRDIVKRTGRSADAVVGKVHRMRLPLRRPPTKDRANRSKPLRSNSSEIPNSCALAKLASLPRMPMELGPMPKTCQWIAGDPLADDRCKCGEKPAAGRPYCAKHAALAYELKKQAKPRKPFIHKY